MSEQMLAVVADAYPHLASVQRDLVGSGFDYASEFEAGLDIILGALPNLRRAEPDYVIAYLA